MDSDLGLAPTKAALIASFTLHRFRVAPGMSWPQDPMPSLWTAVPIVSGASKEVMAPGGVSPREGMKMALVSPALLGFVTQV